jgi:hypothetical protein
MFEMTLARLYTDATFRSRFLTQPEDALKNCGLTAAEKIDLMDIDRAGLLMASRSFLHKRKKRVLSRTWSIRLINFVVWLFNRSSGSK